MTNKFQFVVIHRMRHGDIYIMPRVYTSLADAEVACDWYAANETDAQSTYSAAQVSSRLRVSVKKD